MNTNIKMKINRVSDKFRTLMGDIRVSQASKTNNQKNKKLNMSGWKCVRGVPISKN